MSNRKWFQLSSSLIQVYTQSDISYKFKKLPLEYFYIATAKFSGPIAILYNKFLAEQVQLKLSPSDENTIMIFNPKGQLKKAIPFELKDRVILFKFTQLQQLIILYASGQYVLIDPFSGKRYTGTFFIGQDVVNKTINERCVGAVMDGESIFVIRQRQFGVIRNFKSYWIALANLKPNVQNPIFAIQSVSLEERHRGMMINNDNISNNNNDDNLPRTLIYLSKQNTIEQYNMKTSIKRVLFDNQYLKANYKNLLSISKRKNVLVIVFRNPFKLFYVQLDMKVQSLNTKPLSTVVVHQPLLELTQRPQISKKKSKHNYMSMNHDIVWLVDADIDDVNNNNSNGNDNLGMQQKQQQQSTNQNTNSMIAAYSNGKILIMFNQHSIKAIYNYHIESKMTHSIVEQIDGLRVIGEQHTLYRKVNMIYQELVSLESLQQAQNRIFASTPEMEREKRLLKEKLYSRVSRQGQENVLTVKQKGLVIHQLHELYKKYINKQMIPINELNELKPFAGPMLKQIIQNGIKCLDKLQLIKILKFATFVQNYFTFTTSKKQTSQERSFFMSNNSRQSDQRLSEFKLIDGFEDGEDSMLMMMGNNSNPNNNSPYSFLSTPIHELCSELRILNTLKYASMKRFLTIQQFHYLKYQKKEEFIDMLLRYNMHYELDLIFGDSQSKAKMFYHWAKCKIQKQQQQQSQGQSSYSKSQSHSVNQNQQQKNKQPLMIITTQQQQSSSTTQSDSLIFQTIIQKYESMKDKFSPNNQLFSQLAKYCVDRNKLTLGLKLLEYQQDPQKKALVGLLILVAKKDKHLVQKVLEFTQSSKRSPIIYRIIKQLLNLQWIEKHLWTNLFHNRLLVQEHFIKYNQFIFMYENIKDYYLQNKMLVDLAYMGIRQLVQQQVGVIMKEEQIEDVRSMGMKSLFNDRENQEIKQKIIEQYQSLVPSMCLNLKKHTIKPKSGLSILKKLKNQPNPIIQDDVDGVILLLSDKQLQYLGQIILDKDDNKQLATYIFMKIKSQKSYRILLKQGKYKQAIDLAYERKNVQMLRQMVDSIYGVTQQTEEEYLTAYAHEKIKDLERRGNR